MSDADLNILFELDRLASSLMVIADAANACTFCGPDSAYFEQEVPLAIEDARTALEALYAKVRAMSAATATSSESAPPALRLAGERG